MSRLYAFLVNLSVIAGPGVQAIVLGLGGVKDMAVQKLWPRPATLLRNTHGKVIWVCKATHPVRFFFLETLPSVLKRPVRY